MQKLTPLSSFRILDTKIDAVNFDGPPRHPSPPRARRALTRKTLTPSRESTERNDPSPSLQLSVQGPNLPVKPLAV